MRWRRDSDRLCGSHPLDYVRCAAKRMKSGQSNAWRSVWFETMSKFERVCFEAYAQAIGDGRKPIVVFAEMAEEQLATEKEL